MKRYLKFIVTIMILLSILVALSGCGIKSDVETIEEKTRRELEETTENEAEESDEGDLRRGRQQPPRSSAVHEGTDRSGLISEPSNNI